MNTHMNTHTVQVIVTVFSMCVVSSAPTGLCAGVALSTVLLESDLCCLKENILPGESPPQSCCRRSFNKDGLNPQSVSLLLCSYWSWNTPPTDTQYALTHKHSVIWSSHPHRLTSWNWEQWKATIKLGCRGKTFPDRFWISTNCTGRSSLWEQEQRVG